MPSLRIIITGDIFRVSRDESFGNQTTNIRWLHALLRYPIAASTGDSPDCLVYENAPIRGEDAYALLGQPPSLAAWAELYARMPDELARRYAAAFTGKTVVGFELSDAMCRALSAGGIPYLDISIHPVRFLDDLLFAVRTNVPAIGAQLSSHAVSESLCYTQAGIMSALFAVRRRGTGQRRSLFAAQTHDDRSLFRDNAVLTQDWIAGELTRHLPPDTNLLFKHHPLQRSDYVLNRIGAHVASVAETTDSVYATISDPDIETVYTVSSSVGTEAKYFGKNVVYLHQPIMEPVYRGQAASEGAFYSLGHNLLAADTWRSLLAGIMPVTPPDGEKVVLRPDALRAALGNDWGFGETYSDFVVRSTPTIRRLLAPGALKKNILRAGRFLKARIR